MTEAEKHKILETALDTYGINAQIDVAIEEMAELTQALIHHRRGREANIAEEIADVEIMLEQIKMFYGLSDAVNVQKRVKLGRLAERLKRMDGEHHDS